MATNSYAGPSPDGKKPTLTATNAPMHKRLAAGGDPKVRVPGPKTPA